MRHLVFVLPLLLLVGSCRFAGVCTSSKEVCDEMDRQFNNEDSAGGTCENGVLHGRWKKNGGSDTVEFRKDCTVVDTDCGLSGTYAYSGSRMNITVVTPGIASACPAGAFECDYTVASNTLSTMTCTKTDDTNKVFEFRDYIFQTNQIY